MTLSHVELGEGHPGSVFFSCKIPSFTRNAFNVAHGGALSTYVDITTTAGIFAFDEKRRTQVSAKLDMEFMSAGEIGQDILIEARVNRIGKGISFSEGRLTDAKTQ